MSYEAFAVAIGRKQELIERGYRVEDMGAVWGSDWEGQYRWLNDTLEGDTFGVPQSSEDAAWSDASRFDQRAGNGGF